MQKIIKKIKNEAGVTLVELLAAIAILSIIVTAFLAFFTQAGRTNNVTNEINESVFVAQEEMERITYLAKSGGTVKEASVPENSNADITITADEDSNLYRVVVIIKEGGQTHAKMETYLPFAESAEEASP